MLPLVLFANNGTYFLIKSHFLEVRAVLVLLESYVGGTLVPSLQQEGIGADRQPNPKQNSVPLSRLRSINDE